MSYRARMDPYEQKNFFVKIKRVSNLNWKELARICKVSDKTLRDWARVKFNPSYKVLKRLSDKYGVALPNSLTRLKPYWYIEKSARLGGLACYKIYGPPGSLESRRKGYLKAVAGGRFTTKKTTRPLKLSGELAELAGILLGDGGITYGQIRVTLDKKNDLKYADFVVKLMTRVFGESPTILMRKNCNALDLMLSGICYVEELEKIGIKKGNKIKMQASIPHWILADKDYSRACLRGLMDTDGGVFFHHHKIKGVKYINFGLTFTNHSLPLVKGVTDILKSNGFTPSVVKERRVYIYNFNEIKRYFDIIGSSNQKNNDKLKTHLNWRGARVV